MSHSVPSDSSPADTTFLVGTDLVEFDRSDLPIYATPHSLWAEAGLDMIRHGAPLDRLYGEPGEVFVASLAATDETTAAAALPLVDDPLVHMTGLSDGLILPACEHQPALDAPSHAPHAADMATIYDFGDSHVVVPVHDGWGWDLARPEWFYDHHA